MAEHVSPVGDSGCCRCASGKTREGREGLGFRNRGEKVMKARGGASWSPKRAASCDLRYKKLVVMVCRK